MDYRIVVPSRTSLWDVELIFRTIPKRYVGCAFGGRGYVVDEFGVEFYKNNIVSERLIPSPHNRLPPEVVR